eukprot:191754_1
MAFTSQMLLFVSVLSLLKCISFAAYLDTTLSGGNTVNGAMFDICSKSPANIRVYSFDINCQQAGTIPNFEIYIATATTQSYSSIKDNPSAWTNIVPTRSIICQSSGVSTFLGDQVFYHGLGVSATIRGGECRGFYVTFQGANNILCSNGTLEGNIYSSNNDIEINEGIGLTYPFGSSFTPRIFNGRVYYQVYSMISPTPDWYTLTTAAVAWNSISSQCNSEFGTQAASIHSYEQFQVARATHMESGEFYIWIGLHSTDSGNTWQWNDGSVFDYPSNTSVSPPWYHSVWSYDCVTTVPPDYVDENELSGFWWAGGEWCGGEWRALCHKTITGTTHPTLGPTVPPSNYPTLSPSNIPTLNPTIPPSNYPMKPPSNIPTLNPTNNPIIDPTVTASNNPTLSSTNIPISDPTIYPTNCEDITNLENEECTDSGCEEGPFLDFTLSFSVCKKQPFIGNRYGLWSGVANCLCDLSENGKYSHYDNKRRMLQKNTYDCDLKVIKYSMVSLTEPSFVNCDSNGYRFNFGIQGCGDCVSIVQSFNKINQMSDSEIINTIKSCANWVAKQQDTIGFEYIENIQFNIKDEISKKCDININGTTKCYDRIIVLFILQLFCFFAHMY